MPFDFIAAFGALVLYLGLNVACVLALRACFSATFQRFGLPAVARGYAYMVVCGVASGAALASATSSSNGNIIALLLVLFPVASSVVLLACLLCAWRGWLRFRVMAAATLLLGPAYLAIVHGSSGPYLGGLIIGASLAFAIGFMHGERRHPDDLAETRSD